MTPQSTVDAAALIVITQSLALCHCDLQYFVQYHASLRALSTIAQVGDVTALPVSAAGMSLTTLTKYTRTSSHAGCLSISRWLFSARGPQQDQTLLSTGCTGAVLLCLHAVLSTIAFIFWFMCCRLYGVCSTGAQGL